MTTPNLQETLPALVEALKQGHALLLPDHVLNQVEDLGHSFSRMVRTREHDLAAWIATRGRLPQEPLVFRCHQLGLVAVVLIREHLDAGFRPMAIAERFLLVDQHGPASDHADHLQADRYLLPGTTLEVLAGTPDTLRSAA